MTPKYAFGFARRPCRNFAQPNKSGKQRCWIQKSHLPYTDDNLLKWITDVTQLKTLLFV